MEGVEKKPKLVNCCFICVSDKFPTSVNNAVWQPFRNAIPNVASDGNESKHGPAGCSPCSSVEIDVDESFCQRS